MPVRNFLTEVPSGGVVDVLAGWQYEYLPWPARVDIGMTTDAGAGLMLATVTSGSDTLMEESPISSGAPTGVFPNDLELDLTDEAMAGDRLKIKVRSTSPLPQSVMTRVKLTPLI